MQRGPTKSIPTRWKGPLDFKGIIVGTEVSLDCALGKLALFTSFDVFCDIICNSEPSILKFHFGSTSCIVYSRVATCWGCSMLDWNANTAGYPQRSRQWFAIYHLFPEIRIMVYIYNQKFWHILNFSLNISVKQGCGSRLSWQACIKFCIPPWKGGKKII